MIVNRLKPIRLDLISPTQIGFVKGRQISNGIIVAQETIHSLRSTKSPSMIIKIEFSKAYDQII